LIDEGRAPKQAVAIAYRMACAPGARARFREVAKLARRRKHA
jgi:hypothetical protein